MIHRYPRSTLWPDYLRAAIGVIVTGIPLSFASDSPVMIVILGSLFLLFLGFGAHTFNRQWTQVWVDEIGISTSALRRVSLRWGELRKVSLSYYSTRRDKEGGWMQLNLAGNGRKMRIDSTVEGFTEIVRQTAAAAVEHGLTLDETTQANLVSLGVGKAGASGTPAGGGR
jgi:hypothetical protein